MSDFPNLPNLPLFVTTFSRYSCGYDIGTTASTTTPAVFSWATANLALYYPFMLPWPYPVRRVFWTNGSTASISADFGIYTADGVRLYSTGLTAQSGTSALQYTTPTSFLLPAGKYYFGMAFSNTTANCAYGAGARDLTISRMAGMLQQATSLPLPATITAAAVATANIELCGITRTASGF